MSETLTMANPIETEKIRTHHAKIVVEYTTGEPYYSIEWFDPAKNEYRLGYSSYYIDNVAAWLAEYFEIVEAPKTNAERIRSMPIEEIAYWLIQYRDEWGDYRAPNSEYYDTYEEAKEATIKWLQQPAEGE